ncbi:hypothetical protein J5N97_028982 [Dioscorea zingiberensis]|uniref:Leucine-rich repeat-containing N-terminal plant-type domain-containing protein n=1 Tax=Dioscorea zingiberensis TaxID=325984 RepID=A0A9D5BZU3_9LILI|nr:hypothetical protein J5N97_028982 [Dioscorea zingiberensis]
MAPPTPPKSIFTALFFVVVVLVTSQLSLLIHAQLQSSSYDHHHSNTSTMITTTTTTKSCLETERQALIQFKRGLSDPDNRLSSWIGDHCCSWEGIACSSKFMTGHVVKLDLHNPQIFPVYGFYSYAPIGKFKPLGGKLDPSLLDLKHLQFLDLSNNDFNGIRIPEFIGSFKELKYLNLSSAGFLGIIPHHLGNLSTLHSLDLSYNYYYNYFQRLSMDNAHWLSGLTSLKYLNLSYVDMYQASNWLHSLNMLPSLLEIRLFHCNLYPPNSLSLPFVNFTSLSTLDLRWANINSTIPNWLFNLSSLEYLYLGFNEFQGQIPANIGNLTSLKVLDLSYSFQGDDVQIPTTLGNLCNLDTLVLSDLNLSRESDKLGRIFSAGCLKHSLVELDLSYTSLDGSLPEWLKNLTNLKSLDLSDNKINTTLPSWLYKLGRMENLNLRSNALQGRDIPANIGDFMSSLKILDLSNNDPGLSLPTTLGNLCKLQELSLSGLNLSKEAATIKQIFSGCILQSLRKLSLARSYLQGDMPDWIGGLKNLEMLDLSSNQINSTLPPWLFNLTTISYLELSDNDFQGSIPSLFENMISLEILYLGGNSHLEGPIPVTLGNLCKLRFLQLNSINISQNFHDFGNIFSGCIRNSLQGLYLSNTSLSGHFPDEISNLKSLTYLDIGQNSLSGSIPTTIGSLSSLHHLNLSNNQLSGAIPKSLGQLSYLTYLDLEHNNLESLSTEDHLAIPFTLCTLRYTEVLDFSWNHLSGGLPNCWSNDSGFLVLDFSNNNISGGIPNSVCSIDGLESLHLSNNNLSGVFPTSLRKCKHLVTLDLSHNNFHGSIPHWIGESLPNLEILNLKSNKFSSYLPPQLSTLARVHILDLSHNNFTGSIPKKFGNFNAMKISNGERGSLYSYIGDYYMENVLFVTKGKEQKFERILRLINVMDLSYNSLCGSIPEELTDLSGLQSLNLSGNHLTGEITSKIGKLHELESLDLSRNNIAGAIPSSLDSLDSLGRLNLSHNNLSGKIPSGKHLDTFNDPSIYIGNYNLCGPPLLVNCSEEKLEPQTPSSDGQEKDVWLYLGIGSGFVTGLWSVFVIMLFKKTWRVAYFRCLDDIYDRVYVLVVVNFTRFKRKFQKQEN